MSLKNYHKKRNFAQTPEPKGRVKASQTKNLYLIQKHAASHLHYDFRLELDGTLKSWAVPKGPCLDPSIKRLAIHVEDHPVEYGDFEGIIPPGEYGGGTVMLWDTGTWVCEDDDVRKAYQTGHLTFRLYGKKLKGLWTLIRIRSAPKNWLLIKVNDEAARSLADYSVTEEKPKSVKSNKTMEQLSKDYEYIWGEKGQKKANKSLKSVQPKVHKLTKNIALNLKTSPMPKQIKPQLATLVDQPPDGDEWLHEIKLDGYRLLAFVNKDHIRLMTRGEQDWTHKFPAIVKALKKLKVTNAIFDGEIVVLDEDQHPSFQLLQNSLKDKQDRPIYYYLFDLIYYNQQNLSTTPLIERKRILHHIVPSSVSMPLRYNDHVIGSGKVLFLKICELALEGIISKKINSFYLQKRTINWLKVKCIKRQEFVIGGYTQPRSSRQYFGSLLLGIYSNNKKLIYCGHVGTGFNETSLKHIYNLLQKNQSTKNPFNKLPPNSKNVTWVKPSLVAEIEFREWTKEGILRQASFKGLRNDKPPKKISKEKPIPIKKIKEPTSEKKVVHHFNIKITNPHKLFYPEQKITKLMLIEYYDTIHKWILPYIINRPLTLVRCPEGYQKECFYQKHLDKFPIEHLYAIPIKETDTTTKDSIYIRDMEGLLMLAQMGALEIHPWGSCIESVEIPNVIIFDLDPGPEVTWKKVVAAAFDVKEQLRAFKLKSFVKSTGGKGLHIVVPIKPEYNWDDVKIFCQTFSNFLVLNNTKEYINKMTKSKRQGKIYIDYLRNQRGATAIAPYSTRARANAPVATPLHWEELTNDIRDTTFTLKTIPERLKLLRYDPWKDFFKIKQSLRLDKFK